MVSHDSQPGVFHLRPVPDLPHEERPLDLDELFRQYAPYVAKIGYRLMGRDSEVDDLVQDVFLAAHRGLRKLRNRHAIKGWLATVTVRLARRRLRARRVRVFLRLDSTDDYVQVADSSATPEERALVSRVYLILDGLPANDRIAWTLRHVHGEKLERVADLCGCSLATAKRRIRAAQSAIEKEVSHG